MRAALIGLVLSAALNLVVLFIPMPDFLTQVIVYLQIVGLWIEVRRATPYHMSAWYPFLSNAALYALIALTLMLARRRRQASISIRAV